jgi:uncharacterized membrane protein
MPRIAEILATPPVTVASLVLGQPEWQWAVAGLCVVALVLLASVYWGVSWPARLRVVAALLKAVGIALLAACLLEPLWSGTRAQPGENLVLVVADSTASLTIEDGPGAKPRADQIKQVLADEAAPWQVRLGQEFQIRRYTLDARVDAIRSFENLEFAGAPTSLGGGLSSLLQRYQGQPVAAVLLFTDGNSTDAIDPSSSLWKDGPPIFPVLPDAAESPRDVSIERTSVTQSSFEDAPVTIQADVRAAGPVEGPIVARLLGQDGKVVQEQSLPVGTDGAAVPFRFQVRPTQPLSFYQVQVANEGEFEQFEEGARSREVTLGNNVRQVAVERDPGPYRVLYVAGRPNWEFKFLRRAVAEDKDVNLVGLIRVAKKEAKFEFLGREGESSNPLFRGFKKGGSEEELESYDEAVIIALGVKDETELAGGKFPKTRKELFQYHAIVLDDVEAEFFNPDQLAMLERFVAERGGGLLMLGGPQSFHQGGWQNTPVKHVLPVYCDRVIPPDGPSRADAEPDELRFQLTRDGWLQPWVRLRQTEPEEERRVGEMSGFQVVSRVNGIKPAAQVLANVTDAAGAKHPALVAQTYGDGRGAALLIGDLWRWSMRREPGQPDDLAKAWRQTVRWLVADVPQRIETSLNWETAGESAAVLLRVRVRDEEYLPQENAAVQVQITPPGEDVLTLTAEPSLEEAGVFTTTYVPRQQGAYRADVVVTGEDGQQLGSTSSGWTFEPTAEEFEQIGVNRALMERLASETGGELVAPDALSSFVESLASRDVPVQQAITTPLWHSPWVLATILLCLAAEWGLRRVRGLP